MTDIPSPLTYATLTAEFATISADSADTGSAPDLSTDISGSVSIVPSVRLLRITGDNPQMAIANTITGTIVGGQLFAADGVTPLNVLATDSPGINPSSFQYTATFALSGVAVQPPSIVFNAPGGTSVDLTSIIPASTSPAVQTIVTEASAAAAAASATAAAVSAAAAEAAGSVDFSAYAQLASPALTGNPTAPTATAGDNDTSIATTAFVHTAVAAGGAVSSVAGRTGTVVLAESDVTNLTTDLAAKAPLASPALTGNPTAPTATAGDNDTSIATTAFVTTAVSAEATRAGTAEALKAPIASPTFTGTAAAPTATAGDNSTKVATTAFTTAAISTAIAALVNSAPGTLDTLGEIATALTTDESTASALATTVAGKVPSTRLVNGHALSADVTLAVADISGAAPLASPALTGTPTAPTATASDNSTKVATTAYADAGSAAITAALYRAISALPANSYVVNDWNFSTSAYPLRPTSRTDIIVVWRGPGTPTLGSGYANSNDEYRVKTS